MTDLDDVDCRPGCGACCDPVVLLQPKLDALRQPDLSPEGRAWIEHDLTPMPQREAREKAPHLFPDPTSPRQPRNMDDGSPRLFPNVFRCRHFNTETRLCDNWENRPPTCRDFPRYGLPRVPLQAVLPNECEYRRDQGAVPVILRPREAP